MTKQPLPPAILEKMTSDQHDCYKAGRLGLKRLLEESKTDGKELVGGTARCFRKSRSEF